MSHEGKAQSEACLSLKLFDGVNISLSCILSLVSEGGNQASLRLKVAAMNIISCIFCKCQLPSAEGTQEKYVEHLQVNLFENVTYSELRLLVRAGT